MFPADEHVTFETSWRPGRHEAWLLTSLAEFFAEGVLTDLLFPIGRGKEANVYACRGGAAIDGRLVAAKIWRPRPQRELRNDAIYREGRGLLDDRGHRERARDRRLSRAVRAGTRAGKEASHASWVMHEHAALHAMYAAGGTVPEPLGATPNGVLMALVGDASGPAPTLRRAGFEPGAGPRLLDEVLRDVELLLSLGWVHGDLSPYNLLSWDDRLFLIDFPQVCDVLGNPHAIPLFRRDVRRLVEHLDPARDPELVADAIWDRVFPSHDEDGVPETPIATWAPFLLDR